MADLIQRILAEAIAHGPLRDRPAAIFHDLDRFETRLDALADAFPADALHTLAIKANPLPPLLSLAVDRGFGLEAASRGELELALRSGCPPARIVLDSPVKTPSELRDALAYGVMLNADNLRELERVASLLDGDVPPAPVGLRLNPLVGEGTIEATSVSAADSKFGVPLTRRDAILEAFERFPWLSGLHVHVGSQGYSMDRLVDGVERAVELADAVDARLRERRIDTIDIGGGLPVDFRTDRYADEGRAPSFRDYSEALRDRVPSLVSGDRRLVTEFGRALQARCGWAATRVEYVKDLPDGRLAALHLGADFMLRRVYQPQNWHHQVDVFDADGQPKPSPDVPPDQSARWTLGGPLCFSGDILARDLSLPDLEPGDWVVFRDVGAYTLSMWSRYCSRAVPPVVGHRGDGISRLLKSAESVHDLAEFWG